MPKRPKVAPPQPTIEEALTDVLEGLVEVKKIAEGLEVPHTLDDLLQVYDLCAEVKPEELLRGLTKAREIAALYTPMLPTLADVLSVLDRALGDDEDEED